MCTMDPATTEINENGKKLLSLLEKEINSFAVIGGSIRSFRQKIYLRPRNKDSSVYTTNLSQYAAASRFAVGQIDKNIAKLSDKFNLLIKEFLGKVRGKLLLELDNAMIDAEVEAKTDLCFTPGSVMHPHPLELAPARKKILLDGSKIDWFLLCGAAVEFPPTPAVMELKPEDTELIVYMTAVKDLHLALDPSSQEGQRIMKIVEKYDRKMCARTQICETFAMAEELCEKLLHDFTEIHSVLPKENSCLLSST